MSITRITVKSPHKKPVRGSNIYPKAVLPTPVIIITAAPRQAPDDTPRVYEDARGFCKMACITAPLTASAPPIKKAHKALGILISHKIETSEASTEELRVPPKSFACIIENVSCSAMLTLPAQIPTISAASPTRLAVNIFSAVLSLLIFIDQLISSKLEFAYCIIFSRTRQVVQRSIIRYDFSCSIVKSFV